MNKVMMMLLAALSTASVFSMSLIEARAKTDAVIADPAEMTTVMEQLSAADQKSFVAAVNEAVSKLPGSAEEKSAKALNIARAALKGAAKGNASALIAEILATAPIESLVVINEVFAKDVLNRAADPAKTYTDAQFTKIAKVLMSKVNERVAGTDDAGVRGAFAALMMVRASNGSPASLAAELADTLGPDAGIAKSEWLPAALAPDRNYDPMIAATAAEKVPDARVTLRIAGPQRQEHLLSMIVSGEIDPLSAMQDGFGDWSQVQTTDQALLTLPRTTDPTKPWNPEYPRGYDGQNAGL